jgi:hypothetical protein
MSEQATVARAWSIDGFKRFWSRPDAALVPLINELATSDIVGYWPRPIGAVRGAAPYVAVIDAVLRAGPDLSLKVHEYARAGDLHFVRWVGTVTTREGRVEFNGCDRLKTTADSRVCENYVFCDHPFFADVAALLRGIARS